MEKHEIWLDVENYEGYYQVSSLGRVRSLDRDVWNKANGSYSFIKGKILKLDNNDKDYFQVGLTKEGKRKTFLVHRLVASAFIPNPTLKRTVNHKDCNKLNNEFTNLEWATYSENINHADRNFLVSEKVSKSVACYDNKGRLIKTYKSAKEAEKDGFSRFGICQCCRGKINKHKKLNWEYV